MYTLVIPVTWDDIPSFCEHCLCPNKLHTKIECKGSASRKSHLLMNLSSIGSYIHLFIFKLLAITGHQVWRPLAHAGSFILWLQRFAVCLCSFHRTPP